MRLPIVDEHDVQIGVKARDTLTKDDIYRVSALWVTDTAGRHLLAQRALTKAKNPGKWGPAVAGTVEEGETYESNILKETEEEIGVTLSATDIRKGPKTKRVSPVDTYFVQWFFAVIDKELDAFAYDEREVMGLVWLTEDEFRQALIERPDDFLPSIRESIDRIFSEVRTV